MNESVAPVSLRSGGGAERSNLKWRSSGEAKAFPKGVTAPETIAASATGHDPDYDLELEIALDGGHYVVRSITCRARKRGAVTSEGVTDVPVAKILRIIVARVLGNPLVSGFAPGRVTFPGPTEEALKRVAAVWPRRRVSEWPTTGS